MKKLILAAVLAITMLTGCDSGQPGTKVEGSVYPKITQYGINTYKNTYYYAVDERTGVVYILFSSHKQAGITVALNPDGTPVTKNSLKRGGTNNEMQRMYIYERLRRWIISVYESR